MATADRWMELDDLLLRSYALHDSTVREAHADLIQAEKMIARAALAVGHVALALDNRRLAGMALAAQTPGDLREWLKAVLLQLPQRAVEAREEEGTR